MKALWKGVISFGPMTIPVKLYPATEQQEVRYHYLHKTCHTPLDYARRCPRCELEVPWEDMIRGYEHHNHLVVLTEEELKALVSKGEHTLQLVQCADAAEVDPLYFDKVYYLKPDSGGSKAYILLREALARSNKVAVGTVVLREKEHPVLLRPYQEVLVLHTLFYPPEVESWEKLAPSFGPPRKRELKAAEELIEKLSGGFAPERFTDRFRSALIELLEQKEKKEKEVVKPPRRKKLAPSRPKEAA